MITKRQLSEELDKCIKQDGYAIYIKANSAVMIKEWIKDDCEVQCSYDRACKKAEVQE